MGISFQPMAPYSAAIAEGTGALEQQQRNRDFELRNAQFLADEQAKRNAEAISIARMQQEGQMFGAGLQERDRLQQMAQAHQLGMQERQGQQQLRLQENQQDYGLRQTEFANRLHGQLQEADFNRRITFADRQEQQQRDQGLATVRSMWLEGTLGRTDAENDAMMAQYQQMYDEGTNPYQAREQRDRSQMLREQMTHVANANRMQAEADRQNGPAGHFALPGQAPDDPRRYFRDPSTGRTIMVPGTEAYPQPRPAEITLPDGTKIRGISTGPGHFQEIHNQRPAVSTADVVAAHKTAHEIMADAFRAAGNDPAKRAEAQRQYDTLVNRMLGRDTSAVDALLNSVAMPANPNGIPNPNQNFTPSP